MRPHRTSTLPLAVFTSLLAASLAACVEPAEPEPGPIGEPIAPDRPLPEDEPPVPPDEPFTPPANLSIGCPVEGTAPAASLAVTDPTVLARFPFSRTVAQIRATAGVPGTVTTRTLWRDWMRTFTASATAGDCDDLDGQRFGLRCPRPAESKLMSIDPFAAGSAVRFVPVGLFNRFDLAPGTGAHCGEYRIVYAMQSTSPAIAGRGFFIFEGILANPNPAAGLAACLPVARFWQALSADPSAASRATKLERFYYLGTAVPGFGAVVRAASYGLASGATAAHGAGQIRGNFFVDNSEWNLREYKLRRTCTVATDASTCRLAAVQVPVKANPADELFRGTHALAPSFQDAFLGQVPRLIGTNVNNLGLVTADGFNELESVSQVTLAPPPVRYDVNASPAMRTAITGRLAQLGSSLTASQVLVRATTQTCAGCHQSANNLALGGGLRWPPSLGFAHVDENRRLSPALTGTFLPRRVQVLEGFINARCAPAQPVPRVAAPVPVIADGMTVGGAPIGAAN